MSLEYRAPARPPPSAPGSPPREHLPAGHEVAWGPAGARLPCAHTEGAGTSGAGGLSTPPSLPVASGGLAKSSRKAAGNQGQETGRRPAAWISPAPGAPVQREKGRPQGPDSWSASTPGTGVSRRLSVRRGPV